MPKPKKMRLIEIIAAASRTTKKSSVTRVELDQQTYELNHYYKKPRSLPRILPLTRLLDRHFVKDSIVVGAGSTISRVLGLFFWIVLAHYLTADEVGFVRYCITLAGIIAIAATASPTSIARFLAASRKDPQALDRYFSNGLFGVAAILAVSLVLSIPILWLLHALDPGTILCIVGLAGFYCYFAIARGMGNSWRMGLTYSLSNFVQIAVLIVALGLFRLRSATIALAIYGLTYLTPTIMELIRPMALRFRLSLLSKDVLMELSRFSVPVVIASGAYTLWIGADILFIGNFHPHEAGNYTAAKTLSLAFMFIPAAITNVLLPRAAALGADKSKRYNAGGILIAFLSSLFGMAILIIWGHQLITLTFGQRYSAAYLPLLVLSVGMTIYSVYIVLEGFILGRGFPNLPVQAMGVALVSTGVAGFWLTPRLGMLGASLSFTIGATLSTGVMLFTAWNVTQKEVQRSSCELRNVDQPKDIISRMPTIE